MIFHIHFSDNESSGEIRRIRNIHNKFVLNIDNNVVEVCFISPIKILRKKEFKLSDNVSKKYYFPRLPFSFSNNVFKRLNCYWTSFLIMILACIYRPKYVFVEYSTGGETTKFLSSAIPVVIDVHGASVEEYEYSASNPRIKIINCINLIEKQGMMQAQKIICQSCEMKRYLLKKYPFLNADQIFVYRCTADNNIFSYTLKKREYIRNELEIPSDSCVLTYSGGLMKWQKVDECLRIFKTLHEFTDDLYFLILTGSIREAQILVNCICPELMKYIRIKSVAYNDVPDYLCASDAGFLIRDNIVLNAVAFPTKLAEYMMCGLPVISSSVSDSWVSDNKYIFNVDINKAADLLSFVKNIDRVQVTQFAAANLSLSQDNKEVMRFFNED